MAEQNFDNMVGSEGEIEREDEHTGIQLANFNTGADFMSEDLMIPRLRLMQGLSTEVQDGSANPGQWVLSGYEPENDIIAVPLMFARNRSFRDSEGAVLCRSKDAITGEGEPGGECESCINNQWMDGPNGSRVPPLCVFSYVYIVYVVNFQTLALIEFRRTSINAGKMLNTIVAQRGLGNFAVKMRSSKQTGKRGVFYQAVVQPASVEDDVLLQAKALVGK